MNIGFLNPSSLPYSAVLAFEAPMSQELTGRFKFAGFLNQEATVGSHLAVAGALKFSCSPS